MTRNAIETVMGAVVLAVAAIFLLFAYSSAGVSAVGGYELTAKFDRVDGIRDGGDVRISGIKVGTILSTTLDPKTFQAIVRMSIDKAIDVPTDTVATITSAGLLGDKFLQLVPGADDKTIPPGGDIKFTQPPVNLESLLGQAVFSTPSKSPDAAPKPADAAPNVSPSAPERH
jgi:phospholipid/cholesterol/gamma-HCH transport system substrate-binding protein